MEQAPLQALAYETPGQRPKITTKQIFLMWEKLRVVYNVVLLCVVLTVFLLTKRGEVNWFTLGWVCVMGCLGANLCFFAGPAADAYLNWLGYRHAAITAILFALGLLLSILLAAAFVSISLNPP